MKRNMRCGWSFGRYRCARLQEKGTFFAHIRRIGVCRLDALPPIWDCGIQKSARPAFPAVCILSQRGFFYVTDTGRASDVFLSFGLGYDFRRRELSDRYGLEARLCRAERQGQNAVSPAADGRIRVSGEDSFLRAVRLFSVCRRGPGPADGGGPAKRLPAGRGVGAAARAVLSGGARGRAAKAV